MLRRLTYCFFFAIPLLCAVQEHPVDPYLEITPFEHVITRIEDLNAMMEREHLDVIIWQEFNSLRGFGAFETNPR